MQHELCNILQHTAIYIFSCKLAFEKHSTHCNTLQRTATHCYTLLHTAARCNTLQHSATHCNTLPNTATHCNTLQHTATHCNTLQHTATHKFRLLRLSTGANWVSTRNCCHPNSAGDDATAHERVATQKSSLYENEKKTYIHMCIYIYSYM